MLISRTAAQSPPPQQPAELRQDNRTGLIISIYEQVQRDQEVTKPKEGEVVPYLTKKHSWLRLYWRPSGKIMAWNDPVLAPALIAITGAKSDHCTGRKCLRMELPVIMTVEVSSDGRLLHRWRVFCPVCLKWRQVREPEYAASVHSEDRIVARY